MVKIGEDKFRHTYEYASIMHNRNVMMALQNARRDVWATISGGSGRPRLRTGIDAWAHYFRVISSIPDAPRYAALGLNKTAGLADVLNVCPSILNDLTPHDLAQVAQVNSHIYKAVQRACVWKRSVAKQLGFNANDAGALAAPGLKSHPKSNIEIDPENFAAAWEDRLYQPLARGLNSYFHINRVSGFNDAYLKDPRSFWKRLEQRSEHRSDYEESCAVYAVSYLAQHYPDAWTTLSITGKNRGNGEYALPSAERYQFERGIELAAASAVTSTLIVSSIGLGVASVMVPVITPIPSVALMVPLKFAAFPWLQASCIDYSDAVSSGRQLRQFVQPTSLP